MHHEIKEWDHLGKDSIKDQVNHFKTKSSKLMITKRVLTNTGLIAELNLETPISINN